MRPGLICLALSAALLPACQLSWGGSWSCDVTEARAGSEALEGVSRVALEVGAGFLEVTGDAAVTNLAWHGTACAETLEDLAHVQLEAHREGDLLRLVLVTPDDGRAYGHDLTVLLPDDLPVTVRDGSGWITLRHVAAAEIADGSGDLTVEHVAGDVSVVDGSGSVDLHDVQGRVTIEDGSGDIELLRVGAVDGLTDGSGDVTIHDVMGDVLGLLDGSGDLKLGLVAGSVEVLEDGSGDIVVSDVSGDVRIGVDGSGDITVRSVGGDLDVGDEGSGHVSHHDVGGSVRIQE